MSPSAGCFGCGKALGIAVLVGQTEIFQQLLDGLSLKLVQTFKLTMIWYLYGAIIEITAGNCLRFASQ